MFVHSMIRFIDEVNVYKFLFGVFSQCTFSELSVNIFLCELVADHWIIFSFIFFASFLLLIKKWKLFLLFFLVLFHFFFLLRIELKLCFLHRMFWKGKSNNNNYSHWNVYEFFICFFFCSYFNLSHGKCLFFRFTWLPHMYYIYHI